jgi:hypothetical protein
MGWDGQGGMGCGGGGRERETWDAMGRVGWDGQGGTREGWREDGWIGESAQGERDAGCNQGRRTLVLDDTLFAYALLRRGPKAGGNRAKAPSLTKSSPQTQSTHRQTEVFLKVREVVIFFCWGPQPGSHVANPARPAQPVHQGMADMPLARVRDRVAPTRSRGCVCFDDVRSAGG